MDPFDQLKRDVDRLGRALGHAIREVSGERLFELEETVRALTKRLRTHPSDEKAEGHLDATIRTLSLDEAEGLARAFASYFHLANLAEERHRVRVNVLREEEATPEKPRSESLLAMVKGLKERGLSADEAEALLRSLRLELTFTAHPTESRRDTVRRHLAEIRSLLDELDTGAPAGRLEAAVSLLWATEELRRTRPTVEDEVKAGLGYLPTTLWQALPRLADALGTAFETIYGRRPALDPPVAFHSWIGGDRDGNPNVTPEVTRWAQAWARETALRHYVDEIDGLIRSLSAAQNRAALPEELGHNADEAIAAFGLQNQFEGEPLRRHLMVMRAKVRALLGERDVPGYEDDAALRADFDALVAALEAGHLAQAARWVARPARVRAGVFGLDLVKLDLREESSEHEIAVAELLKTAGITDDYAALSPAEKEAVLNRELATARPLAPVGRTPETKALRSALGALNEWKARGAHVISMARDATDALEVLVLAREVGLYRPGAGAPFDVSPLFETLGDLEAAPAVVRSLLRNPVFRSHVDARGGLEVMIGYSDSNKDAGYLAASWALAQAQHGIAEAARAEGVRVSFFHGRGTSTARGGGPAGRAIASLPEGTVGPRVRLTEQGEALADRYAHPALAFRHLEQLIHHLALAAARDRGSSEDFFDVHPDWIPVMDACAKASSDKYRGLLHTERFFEFFEQFTPIREIASLKIASRPVYRHGRVRDVKDLRAIPWVMSWTQVRANLPGWYGIGTGLERMDVALRRRLYKAWPLFRSTLDGAAMSLAKGDLGIARRYCRLAEPELAQRFLPMIEDEWRRTQALLEETFEGPLLWSAQTLQRSIDLRNPYVDPINHVQVELLARWRALPEEHPDRPRTERALLTTLLGIAAGLRNTG